MSDILDTLWSLCKKDKISDCPFRTADYHLQKIKKVLRIRNHILEQETELAQVFLEIEKIFNKLENGTLHVIYCNGNHSKRVGTEGMICNCTLGKEIKDLRFIAKQAKDRLMSLIQLTDQESAKGKWQVTLDYDNYHDGARVINGDGIPIGSCYDINLEPDQQFLSAIDQAIQYTKDNEKHRS